MNPLIIYHGAETPCPDGSCAAWVAWKHFHKDVELHPSTYSKSNVVTELIKSEIKDREIYILDFSYSKDILNEICKSAKKVVVLDHHASAQKDLDGISEESWFKELGNLTVVFDMNKSGAGLTWEYFNSNMDAPNFVKYIQDRDLWQWELPMSREIGAAISSYNYDIPTYDKLSEKSINELYDEGSAILRYQNNEIELMIKNSYITKFGPNGEYDVPICNCPVKSLSSELAARLARKHKFAVTWYQTSGKFYYSLRSITGEKNPIGLNVSEIAKAMGGGGHANAAGINTVYQIHTNQGNPL